MLPHMTVSRVIEHVICMTGAEQIEKIQPALREPGAEPREPVIADLCAKAVLPRMTRAGVVHRYKRRCLKSGTQNILSLGDEAILFVRQQTLQLPLRDGHTNRS